MHANDMSVFLSSSKMFGHAFGFRVDFKNQTTPKKTADATQN